MFECSDPNNACRLSKPSPLGLPPSHIAYCARHGLRDYALVSPVMLLHPRYYLDASSSCYLEVLADLEELVLPHGWPLAAKIVHCHVSRLHLNFPVDDEQSDFVLEGWPSEERLYVRFVTERKRARLLWVMIIQSCQAIWHASCNFNLEGVRRESSSFL